MAKKKAKKKPAKKRASKYEEKLSVTASFDEVLKMTFAKPKK